MKTLVALAEVVGLVPIIDSGPQPSTPPVLGDPMSSSDLCRLQVHCSAAARAAAGGRSQGLCGPFHRKFPEPLR